MKKLLSAICLSLSFFVLFCGCQSARLKEGDVTLLSNGTSVVIRAENTVDGASLFDALTFLNVDFTYEDGAYGAEIKTVNQTTPKSNEFWAIYTSLSEYGGVSYSSVEWGSYLYGEQTLASASYGCSYLPVVEGCIYVLALGCF